MESLILKRDPSFDSAHCDVRKVREKHTFLAPIVKVAWLSPSPLHPGFRCDSGHVMYKSTMEVDDALHFAQITLISSARSGRSNLFDVVRHALKFRSRYLGLGIVLHENDPIARKPSLGRPERAVISVAVLLSSAQDSLWKNCQGRSEDSRRDNSHMLLR